MRLILLLVSLVTVVNAEAIQSHEWTDASRKHSIEAEFVDAKVTLRLPDGRTKVVDMQSLSEADQQFIITTLHDKSVPAAAQQQPPKELPQLIVDLKAALSTGDKTKVTAATKAIREADATCNGVKGIVSQLMCDGSADSIAKALWVLSEVGTNTDWALSLLWSLQDHVNFPARSIHVDNGNGVDVEIAFENDPIVSGAKDWEYLPNSWYELVIFANLHDLTARAEQAEPCREVTRLIAEYAAKDKRVKEMFDKET